MKIAKNQKEQTQRRKIFYWKGSEKQLLSPIDSNGIMVPVTCAQGPQSLGDTCSEGQSASPPQSGQNNIGKEVTDEEPLHQLLE